MPRYVDANLIKLVGLPFEDVNHNVYFSLTDVRKAIEQTPTADVVEVRYGNAIYGDHDEWWGAVYECSICGEKWMLESSSYKTHYCPYCGAKMDGERKEQG